MIKKSTLFIVIVASLFVLPTPAQSPHSESSFRAYFDAHIDSLEPLEGIWNVSTIQQFYRYDTLYDVQKFSKAARIAIMRNGDHYDSFNLTGESYNVQFIPSDVAGVYIYKNYFKEVDSYSKASAVISKNGRMEFSYEFPEKYLRFKLNDSYEEGTRVMNNTSWTKAYPEMSKAKKK
jgi:hypothetical protein